MNRLRRAYFISFHYVFVYFLLVFCSFNKTFSSASHPKRRMAQIFFECGELVATYRLLWGGRKQEIWEEHRVSLHCQSSLSLICQLRTLHGHSFFLHSYFINNRFQLFSVHCHFTSSITIVFLLHYKKLYNFNLLSIIIFLFQVFSVQGLRFFFFIHW